MFAVLTVVLSVVLCLAAIEVVLRFLPVATGLRGAPVTAQDPVFHYEPDARYVFSIGWDLEQVNRGRTNNVGFVNDQDYRKDDRLPLIAVVGDSFIEALMVPYADTVQGRLAAAVAGDDRVYSFAASGAPLSQYLIWARHAVNDYGARAVVINVVFNDFDESYAAYRRAPGYWFYVTGADGRLTLKLFEHRGGLLRSLALTSALACYLMINLKLEHFILETPVLHDLLLGRPAMAQPGGADELPVDADAERMRISYAVIDAFFRDLAAMVQLPPEHILFTVDGFHYPDNAAANTGRYFDRMRKAFIARAQALGYGAIDLDPFFFAHYREHGEKFEVPGDGHWNATGHAVVAAAVLGSAFMKRLRGAR